MLEQRRPEVAWAPRLEFRLLVAAAVAVLLLQAVPLRQASGLFGHAGDNSNSLSTSVLVAPTGVFVADAQQTTLEVRWNASPSTFVSGYQVYRSEGSGGPYAPVGGPLGAGSLSMIDGGLAPETTYSYVIRALGAGWESVDSTEALGTTLP